MENIPRSYKELNYKKYVAIINKIPSEKPEGVDEIAWSRTIHLATLSVLLGIPEVEVEALRAAKVNEMIECISFLNEPITQERTSFKVKDISELSFGEFSTYQQLRKDQWNNLADILSLVLKDSAPDQIDAMSIYEVMQVFFCLNKSAKKSLRRSKYSAVATVIIQRIKRALRLQRN